MKAWFEMTESDHVPYEELDGDKDKYYLFCMRMLWNNYFKNYTQWEGYSQISRHDFLHNQHGLALLRNHPLFEKGFQIGKEMTMRIADRMNVIPP